MGQFEEAQSLATMMLSDSLEGSPRLDLLTLSGRSYELSHNLLKALKQYEEALTMCERHPELARWKGTILKNLGRVTREMRRTDSALDYYKQALSIAEEPGDIAAILNSIGYVWALQGRYRGASKYCRQALLIYKTLKNRDRDVGTTLATIGEVFRNQNHYAQAIDYYYQALPYFECANDLIWLARLYSRRGAVHRLQGNYELAIKDLETSLHYDIKEEQPWTLHVLGCVFWNERNWDMAEEKFRQSDVLACEMGDIRSRVNNLVGYAELYFDRYRWANSEQQDPRYLELIKEKAGELEVLLQQGYGFEHHHGRMKRALADAYFYEENYKLALENYKDAYTLLESRLGGYARLTSFEGEVDHLAARIMELATLGKSQLATAWCQDFRKHWENAELRMMQKDLLLSMCDICEMDIKLHDKGIL
jgi:tetratricopeptide (TPR) repeat protein